MLIPLLMALVSSAEPVDFRVACLDTRTGDVTWKSSRADLPRPVVETEGDVLLVRTAAGEPVRFSPVDGSEVAEKGPGPELGFSQAEELPAPLKLTSGATLVRKLGARELVFESAGRQHRSLEVEAAPWGTVAVGNRAVFTYEPQALMGARLLAVDVVERRFAWELDLSRRMADLDERRSPTLGVLEDDVIIAVDGWVARVDVDSGAFLWSTPLPRDLHALRGTGLARIGRHADTVVAMFDDVVMGVGVRNGELLWAYAGGVDSRPWPVFVESRVLFPWRDARTAPRKDKPARLQGGSAVAVVSRDPRWLGKYQVEFIPRARVAPREQILTPMTNPPPPQTDGKGDRMVLLLVEAPGEGSRSMSVDVTEAVKASARVFVRVGPSVQKVLLMEGTRQVYSATR